MAGFRSSRKVHSRRRVVRVLTETKRILIVKPSSLGDVVHTLPVLAHLRQLAPAADIRWVVNSVWAPLLREHPLLDGLIEFPRGELRGAKLVPRVCRWVNDHSGWRADLAIDVQGLLRSALLARALRPRVLIGYDDAREGSHWLHGYRVDTAMKRSSHAVDRYLTLFPFLSVDLPDEPEFPLPEGDPLSDEVALPEDAIALHPFSRGAGKSLSVNQVERFVELAEGRPVVLVGRFEGALPSFEENVTNLLNETTLPQLIWVLRRVSAVVSVDSGPMHLAAALAPKVVSIHGWSDPCRVGPYPDDAQVWKDGQLWTMRDYRTERQGAGPQEDERRGSGTIPDEAVDAAAEAVWS